MYNYPIMTMNNLMEISVSVGALLTTYFLLNKFIKPILLGIRHTLDAVHEFLRDWAGEDARPGRDAIPGVMERLNAIDGQLKNNGGSTIKDAVDRIERRVNHIDERLAEGDQDFETIYKEIEVIKSIADRRREISNINFPDRRQIKSDDDSTQQ